MIVAAANVRSDHHVSRLVLQCQIVDREKLLLDIFQINAQGLIPLFCSISHDRTPSAVVQLQIAAACIIELPDHFLICNADVVDQFFIGGIEFSGTLEVLRHDHLLEHLCRCRNGVLCNRFIIFKLFQELEVCHKRVRHYLDLSGQVGIFQI